MKQQKLLSNCESFSSSSAFLSVKGTAEKLSDIKSSHNGGSKEIKSINNPKQKGEQLRKENYLQSRSLWRKQERKLFAQLNIIQFLFAPLRSLSRVFFSFRLKQTDFFS